MLNNASDLLSIKLNNFVHRIDSKSLIVEMAIQHRCTLRRIRRSKNWSLIGVEKDLIQISLYFRENNSRWIAEAIDKALPKPTTDLSLLLKSNPGMTVNELVAASGCSLVEARSAIDSAEQFI
ncbi:ribosome recycling factor family protein [Vibrio sp. 2-Bac 85]